MVATSISERTLQVYRPLLCKCSIYISFTLSSYPANNVLFVFILLGRFAGIWIRCRWITQNEEYDIQDMAKVWNQECSICHL